MTRSFRQLLLLTLAGVLLFFTGCATPTTGTVTETPTPERMTMYRAIASEPLGDYYIARRYYKQHMAIWGYVRRPRQPWHEAQLVLLNEDQKLSYDKSQGSVGIDNNYEYRLYGRFGGTVYEPASNAFYPEFLLRDYEIIDRDPPSIFSNRPTVLPSANVIETPQRVDPRDFPSVAVAGTGAPAYIPPRPLTVQ